ncbi:MAG TPA: asparaginase [Candidatus Cloacimonadota bacterium]|nr:asparaginase [Candidatus Cloacimonadota bacterium]
MSDMNNLAVKRTRGKIVEAKHYAHICVINSNKEIIASLGDPFYYTFLRSSAKPIQALQIIISGTAERYQFTSDELALMCASHYGEQTHINTVLSIMKKAGISLSEFRCGVATSLNPQYALELARRGIQDSELISDCSGKHSGMLAVCKHNAYPVTNYLDINHPVQQENLRLISLFSEYSADQISIGIDGCSVPVFAMPLFNMAVAFLNLAVPDQFDQETQQACNKIFHAMNEFPFMVSGTGGFCTALMKATKGRLIGKIGAEGVYCIALKNEKLAISLKIEDGSLTVVPSVAIHTLKQLDLLSNQEYHLLEKFHYPDILNDNGLITGQTIPDFKLNFR